MKPTNKTRILSVILSLMMVLSVISIPSLKTNAAGGVDGFVERCYTVTLGRGSDAAGFADWKDQLLNGKSVGVNIAYGFLFSAEYTNKKKSNEDYVKDLYKLFMDRDPDQAGFNDWVGKLNQGQSREEVFAGFANSQEFYNICESYGITAGSFVVGYDRKQVNNVNLFVERLYQTCLGRRGDRNGQKDWVNKLVKQEITGIECARSFVQSKEYINKGLNDDQYVENLYKAFMGRSSDAEGKSNWLYALANGMTRDEVFAGFANSTEFGKICESYKINKGSYTAKDKGTYDPNKQQNNQQNNNQNNTNNQQNNNNNQQNTNQNNNNNQNTNNQNNNKQNTNNQSNTNNNNQNQQNNNQQNNTQQNNTQQNNNQQNNNNQTPPKPEPVKHTGYRLSSTYYGVFVRWTEKNFITGEYSSGTRWDEYNFEFTYDEKKSKQYPVSIVKTNKVDGSLAEKSELEMDSRGLPIKKTVFKADGSVYETEEYTFNDKGQLLQIRIPEKGLSINNISIKYQKHDFEYDSEGRVIQYLLSYDNFLEKKVIYEYDSNGLVISAKYQTYYNSLQDWVDDGINEYEYSNSNLKAIMGGDRIIEFNSVGDVISDKIFMDSQLRSEYDFAYEEFEYYDDDVYDINELSSLGIFLSDYKRRR